MQKQIESTRIFANRENSKYCYGKQALYCEEWLVACLCLGDFLNKSLYKIEFFFFY